MTDDASDLGVRRRRMVEAQLVSRGIDDPAVLAAMCSVPRHLFVPADAREAYIDAPLPIGYGQTISQPYMVAIMTSLLQIDVHSRVLEVGAGSGYQTAVLAELAGEICAIERLAPLAERARKILGQLGYRNVRLAIGDGTRGWPELAPFDGILVAAAAAEVPGELLAQLADGGRLVIPLGRGTQVLTIITRDGDGFVERHDTGCRFVPLVRDPEDGGPEPTATRAGRPSADRRAGGRRGNVPAGGTRPDVNEEAVVKSVDVRVSGMVQGVYYRGSAHRQGVRLGLRGWVRNRSDGSVDLHLEGDAAVVDAMLDWCRIGPSAARVSRVEVRDAPPDGSLTGFEVR